MGRSSSEEKADPVSEILFSFYNGTLYRDIVLNPGPRDIHSRRFQLAFAAILIRNLRGRQERHSN
jgi:hypothetical protein